MTDGSIDLKPSNSLSAFSRNAKRQYLGDTERMSLQVESNTAIVPQNWESVWSDEAVAFLKPLLKNIKFAFIERDHDVFLQLWTPGCNPKGSFISMGIRAQGKQKNGNPHSALFAFGFFYEHAYRWPDGFVDHMADLAVAQYARFQSGEWPIDQIHTDDETLKRNANITAPEARRTMSHHGNAEIKKITPTKDTHFSVKKLNAQMEAALKKKPADPWAAIEQLELEVDPLS